MSRKSITYRLNKIRPLVEKVARWASTHPELLRQMEAEGDYAQMHATIASHDEAYGDKKSCYNCGHSMALAVYTVGTMEALLVLEMAKKVRGLVGEGKGFTEANLVHVPTLNVSDATRHSVTRAAYVGLVAQPANKKGSGYWVVTHWGWKFLRGELVPRSATFWRGQLIERSEETTDIAQAFKTHTDLVEKALLRRRSVSTDYRADMGTYAPQDWIGFGGYAEEVLPRAPEEKLIDPWWNKEAPDKV